MGYSIKADILDKDFYNIVLNKVKEYSKKPVRKDFEPKFYGSFKDCLKYNLLTKEEVCGLKTYLDKEFNC